MREKTDETKGFEETLGDYFCPKYSSGVFQSCRSEESGRFFSLPFSLCLLKKSLGQNADPFLPESFLTFLRCRLPTAR